MYNKYYFKYYYSIIAVTKLRICNDPLLLQQPHQHQQQDDKKAARNKKGQRATTSITIYEVEQTTAATDGFVIGRLRY